MQKMTDVERGWAFASKFVGAHSSSQNAAKYISNIEKEIQKLEQSINNHSYRGQDVAHFKGYVAEEWAGGTFNVDAVAAGSKDRATVLHSNEAGSVDIQLKSGKKYSSKICASGEKSAVEQAKLDPITRRAVYDNQERYVADDQLTSAKAEAHRLALSNQSTRPDVAEAYRQTEEHLTSEVKNDEGIKSIKKNKSDFEKIAKDGKKQRFSAEKQGLTIDSAIKPEYIVKQAVKAGLTAATVTMIMKTAPDILKAISYLINTGELDLEQVQQIGTKAISAGAEGFLNGSIACTLQILCEKGAFGAAMKAVDATILGTMVALTMETIKNSILVAAGKMTPRQMGGAFVDSAVISAGYIVGAKIGGTIAQAIGWEFPGIAYALGSLIGCACAAVYNIGKKKLISFCVDTGFTCFGLVEQDYSLPEDVLNDMGIDLIPISRTEISHTPIDRVQVSTGAESISRVEYDTIEIKFLRRGIIGANRVGYV